MKRKLKCGGKDPWRFCGMTQTHKPIQSSLTAIKNTLSTLLVKMKWDLLKTYKKKRRSKHLRKLGPNTQQNIK